MSDPEIDALGKIAAALENLEDDARVRVLQWAAQRFGVTLARNSGGGERQDQRRQVEQTDNANLRGASGYETLAELFDAADPTTDAHRALVAAYWITSSTGVPDFQAQPVNTQLKDLGYPLSNVTDALTALKDRKPALVLQTKKDGTSRQARKTYRLTAAGKKAVDAMLSSDGDDT